MKKGNKTQKGSALVYILIAIALLAALTATFMDSSSTQTSAQSSTNLVSELSSQINFIRSAIEECVLTYPGGDATMPANPVGSQYPVRPYPLIPNNPYLSAPTVGTYLTKDIGCPGNPGNSNNHAKIFGGSSGKFLPPAPKLFGEWKYYNNTDGVFIMNATSKTDSYIGTALQKLDAQFSKCEFQYIDASSNTYLTSNSTSNWECLAGEKCIITRLRTTATAIYPGDTGCP